MSRFRNSILANENTVTPIPDRAYKLFPLSNFNLGWNIVKEFNDCSTVQNKQYIIAFNDTVSSYKNESGDTMYFCEKSVSDNFTPVSNGSTYSFTSGTTHRFAIGITSTITKYNKGVIAIYNGYATSISYGGRDTSAGSSDCTTLKQFYYNNNLTEFGYFAFAHNTSLTTPPFIQGNVTKLYEHAFRGLINVSGILDMSKSRISLIQNGVFNSIGISTTNGLTDVIFPTVSCNADGGVFWGAKVTADNIILNSNMTLTGNNLFGRALGIKGVTVDTYLSEWAFRQDGVSASSRTLKTVIIKEHCTGLGSQAFNTCTEITDIYLYWTDSSIISYSSSAFPNVYFSSNRIIHVPVGQSTNYTNNGWGNLGTIVEN